MDAKRFDQITNWLADGCPDTKTHELKTDPVVFEAVITGKKTYEIRYNDRDYQVGDTLILRETKYPGIMMKMGKPLEYTGREYKTVVSHVLLGPLYGLTDRWAILSFESDLRAKLEAAEEAKNAYIEEYHAALNNSRHLNNALEDIKKDRDNLQAANAVLVDALKGICQRVDFTERVIKGERRIATIPTGLTRQCNLEKAIETADYILSTTPTQAAERVNGLVEALEKIKNQSSWMPDRMFAMDALAKYHGKEVKTVE